MSNLVDYPYTEWQTFILGPYGGDPYEWTFPILPVANLGHTKLFPARATLGPPDPNVDDTLSTLNFMDLSGGQGIATINPSTDLNRYWWGAGVDTRWADGWTLGPEATSHRPAVYAGNFTPIGRVGDGVYGLWGTEIHQWDPDDLVWSNSVRTAGTVVGDPIVFNDTVFFPLGASGYSYCTESASRTMGAVTTVAGAAAPTVNDPVPTSNPKVLMFGIHQQNLWAVTTLLDGYQLCSSAAGLTNTWFWPYNVPRTKFVKVEKGALPRHLVEFLRADGQKGLWCICRRGGLIFNDAEVAWEETNLWEVPPHPAWGAAVLPWRPGEAIWIAAGGGDLLQYTSSNVAQSAQGPGGRGEGLPNGRNEGMPGNKRGDIVSLTSDLANMYCLLRADTTAGTATSMVEDTSGADALTLPQSTSGASVLAFTGKGWHVLWETADPGSSATQIRVADGLKDDNTRDYRVHWGIGEYAWEMPCRLTMYSARQGRERGLDRFQSSGYIEFGEFNAGAMAIKKLNSHFAIQMRHASSVEYVELEYQTDADDDATWHVHPTTVVLPNVRTVLPLGLSDDGRWAEGLAAYWIKFRIGMVGAGSTTSPTMRALTLAYTPLQQDSAHANLTIPLPVDVDERSGKTREQILSRLEDLLRSVSIDPQFLVMKLAGRTYRVLLTGMAQNEIAAQDRAGAVNLSIIQIPTGDSSLLGES